MMGHKFNNNDSYLASNLSIVQLCSIVSNIVQMCPLLSDCVHRWEKEDTNLVKNFFKDVTNAKRKVAHTNIFLRNSRMIEPPLAL